VRQRRLRLQQPPTHPNHAHLLWQASKFGNGTKNSRICCSKLLTSMDTLTPQERSERMSRIRGRDTKPELAVRRLVHALGYRYRLHRSDLPGTPDLTFVSRRATVFVHGCFWHRHEQCPLARLPKSRLNFWQTKLEANKKRDRENQDRLRLMGWKFLVIWECELKDMEKLTQKIIKFLGEKS
jgi:DNA mismatch endonuclease, patch repair protein